MTRKDYIAFAAALVKVRPRPVVTEFEGQSNTFTDYTKLRVWSDARGAIADVLCEDNDRFDWLRFYDATEA